MNVIERILVIKHHLYRYLRLPVLGMEKLGVDKCPLLNPPPCLRTAGLQQGTEEALSCGALCGGQGPTWVPLYSGSPEIFWGHIPLSQQLFSSFRYFPALRPQRSLQCPACSLCPNILLPLPILPSRPAQLRFPLPVPMPGLCSFVPVVITQVTLLIYCPLSGPHPQPGSMFVREGTVSSLPLQNEALGLVSNKCSIHIC